MHAIVAIIPHDRAIIPQTKPAVALPFCSGSFLLIAPKITAIIPQIEPIQPKPAAPPATAITNEMIPKTNDATAMFTSSFFCAERKSVICQINSLALMNKLLVVTIVSNILLSVS